ncbi:MAG: hypothetical protein JXD19_01845 [Deltaproteobacteria bacterium]|nr:hypothetical protein [Deltaproteobacteria bacterium]
MGHTCSAALLKCMDFRLTGDTCRWLEEKGLVNDCDIISVAGAAKDLVENPEGYVFSLIKLSVELHHVTRLIIMHHLDCGAYGGSAAFESLAEEREMHRKEIQRAREIIRGNFPAVVVESYFLSPEGKRWTIETM